LRQKTVNDLPVGRSVDETLRLVKAFQVRAGDFDITWPASLYVTDFLPQCDSGPLDDVRLRCVLVVDVGR
jgi:hypothetical protein